MSDWMNACDWKRFHCARFLSCELWTFEVERIIRTKKKTTKQSATETVTFAKCSKGTLDFIFLITFKVLLMQNNRGLMQMHVRWVLTHIYGHKMYKQINYETKQAVLLQFATTRCLLRKTIKSKVNLIAQHSVYWCSIFFFLSISFSYSDWMLHRNDTQGNLNFLLRRASISLSFQMKEEKTKRWKMRGKNSRTFIVNMMIFLIK